MSGIGFGVARFYVYFNSIVYNNYFVIFVEAELGAGWILCGVDCWILILERGLGLWIRQSGEHRVYIIYLH